MQDKPIIIRTILLGSSCVGKTSLCGQYASHCFSSGYIPTHDLNTFRILTLMNDIMIHMQIDDLFPINHFSLLDPSQENSKNREIFENIIENKRNQSKKKQKNPIYVEKAIDAIIFVFDISNKESFQLVEKIINYVHNKEQERIREKHPRITAKYLVGNKSDLSGSPIKINDIERVKNSFGLNYIKTSALTNKNVDELFQEICKGILEEKYSLDSLHTTVDSEFAIEETSQRDIFSWCDCSKRTKNPQICNIY